MGLADDPAREGYVSTVDTDPQVKVPILRTARPLNEQKMLVNMINFEMATTSTHMDQARNRA